MRNIAVILAGGKGSRMNDSLPKQFMKIAGKRVIEHTLEAFEKHPLIDEICIVTNQLCLHEVENIVVTNHLAKVKKILLGGKERYHSSLAAIKAYEGRANINLLFHDAVRPLVSENLITKCVEAMQTHEAIDVAVNVADTIIMVDGDDEIIKIPNRDALRSGQTPQGFRLEVIQAAYERAMDDPNFKVTDDCGVVLKYLPEVPIHVVKGERVNMKLTYPEDIFVIDKYHQLRSSDSESAIFSTATLKKLQGKVVVVIGGSYGIGNAIVNELQDLDITSVDDKNKNMLLNI